MGMARAGVVASRHGLAPPVVEELLLDFEATGLVTTVEFAGTSGWMLTAAGHAENARQLAKESARPGVRETVEAAHETFVELNARFLAACTAWQIRPTPWDPLASNDHGDPKWDERVLDKLATLDARLRPVCADLTAVLRRFDRYADRFSYALARVERGERSWVDQLEVDSCHTVWIQLHEDLIATLGLERGADARTE